MAELLEDLQRRAERAGPEAFLARHKDPLLVRLDERGGKDEPIPWAFAQPPPPTGTNPTAQRAVPVAGGLATVHEVVKVSGSGPRDTVLVGRGADNDVVLEEKSISKVHVAIKRIPDGYLLVDQKSRNGTRLNGQKIPANADTPLKSGDVIHLGDVAVLFVSGQDLLTMMPSLLG